MNDLKRKTRGDILELKGLKTKACKQDISRWLFSGFQDLYLK
jgi:hypothetical protein